jgi:hypothetical protein
LFPADGKRNLLRRSFLRFLGKPIRQDQQSSAFEKAPQPENIITKMYADFPDAFTVNQFLLVITHKSANGEVLSILLV